MQCRSAVMATVYAEGKRVFMKTLCAHRKDAPVVIASDYDWYMERYARGYRRDHPAAAAATHRGCPNDCGLCSCHSNRIVLPVFSITNDCNLDCPICFTYNRPDRKYYKSVDETRRIVEHLVKHRQNLDVINLTGGEPTMHPELFSIIDLLKSSGFRRITVNTNGQTMANDEELCDRIRESGVQMVLSLNSFDPSKNIILHGKDISGLKRETLARCENRGIPVTLLCVALKDFNEEDIAGIIRDYFPRKFIRNVVIQTMTFTGAHGKNFTPRCRITLDDVENALEASGCMSRKDFFPLGSSHPLCYSIAYYFVHDGGFLPLTRLVDKELLIAMTQGGYLLSADPKFHRAFLDGINKVWAEGEDEKTIGALRKFFKELFSNEHAGSEEKRSVLAEKSIKSIYIHSHMDEDTIDLGRVSRCGDIVPDESGTMIPACSYNLLYREKDERFWH